MARSYVETLVFNIAADTKEFIHAMDRAYAHGMRNVRGVTDAAERFNHIIRQGRAHETYQAAMDRYRSQLDALKQARDAELAAAKAQLDRAQAAMRQEVRNAKSQIDALRGAAQADIARIERQVRNALHGLQNQAAAQRGAAQQARSNAARASRLASWQAQRTRQRAAMQADAIRDNIRRRDEMARRRIFDIQKKVDRGDISRDLGRRMIRRERFSAGSYKYNQESRARNILTVAAADAQSIINQGRRAARLFGRQAGASLQQYRQTMAQIRQTRNAGANQIARRRANQAGAVGSVRSGLAASLNSWRMVAAGARARGSLARGHFSAGVAALRRPTRRAVKRFASTALGAALGGAASGVGLLLNSLNLLVTGLTAAANAVLSFGKYAYNLTADLELTRTRMGVFAGGGETGRMTAARTVEDIETLAIRTPYNASQLQKVSDQLLSMGVPMKMLLPTLEKLGAIAGGDAERLGRLAYAFGQVYSAKRFMGTELRQFTEAGVGVSDFARANGMTEAEYFEKQRLGQLTDQHMIRGINALSNPGGRFFGMNEESMGTLRGLESQVRETFDKVMRRVGETIIKELDVKGAFKHVIAAMDSLPRAAELAAGDIKAVTGVVKTLVVEVYETGLDVFRSFRGSITDYFRGMGPRFTAEGIENAVRSVAETVLKFGSVVLQVGGGFVAAMSALAKVFGYVAGALLAVFSVLSAPVRALLGYSYKSAGWDLSYSLLTGNYQEVASAGLWGGLEAAGAGVFDQAAADVNAGRGARPQGGPNLNLRDVFGMAKTPAPAAAGYAGDHGVPLPSGLFYDRMEKMIEERVAKAGGRVENDPGAMDALKVLHTLFERGKYMGGDVVGVITDPRNAGQFEQKTIDLANKLKKLRDEAFHSPGGGSPELKERVGQAAAALTEDILRRTGTTFGDIPEEDRITADVRKRITDQKEKLMEEVNSIKKIREGKTDFDVVQKHRLVEPGDPFADYLKTMWEQVIPREAKAGVLGIKDPVAEFLKETAELDAKRKAVPGLVSDDEYNQALTRIGAKMIKDAEAAIDAKVPKGLGGGAAGMAEKLKMLTDPNNPAFRGMDQEQKDLLIAGRVRTIFADPKNKSESPAAVLAGAQEVSKVVANSIAANNAGGGEDWEQKIIRALNDQLAEEVKIAEEAKKIRQAAEAAARDQIVIRLAPK